MSLICQTRNRRRSSIFGIVLRLPLLYDLPGFDNQHGVVRKVLGGWQASSIMTFSTGFASRINGVGDTTGTGISSRPSIVAGQNPVIDGGGGTRNELVQHGCLFRDAERPVR